MQLNMKDQVVIDPLHDQQAEQVKGYKRFMF